MKKRLRLPAIIFILCFLVIPATDNMAKGFENYASSRLEAKSTEDYSDEIEYTEEEVTKQRDDVPYHFINELEVKVLTKDKKSSKDKIYLKKNETATIEITASPAELEDDDIFIDYDIDLLSVELLDISSDKSKNSTKYTYQVQATAPGSSDILILSAWDLWVNGEKASYLEIPVVREPSSKDTDSKKEVTKQSNVPTVYITPTGKRYHISAECAGKNAIPTSLDDAENRGYGPCQTCVE